MSTFLTAEWRNLVNLTWRLDPQLLQPYLPKGVAADLRDGMAHVSLVAFDFLNTRVKGYKLPFHVNFPEINLRYYVKYQGKRGVSFLREFVPKHCIAYIAKRFYNEPYLSYPMESKITENPETGLLTVEHKLWKDGEEFSLSVNAEPKPFVPTEDSIEHYFKEHDLGVGKGHGGETLIYAVEHPQWEVYPVKDFKLNLDFGKLYGPEWAFLNQHQPAYAMLAKGSAVKVFSPEKAKE